MINKCRNICLYFVLGVFVLVGCNGPKEYKPFRTHWNPCYSSCLSMAIDKPKTLETVASLLAWRSGITDYWRLVELTLAAGESPDHYLLIEQMPYDVDETYRFVLLVEVRGDWFIYTGRTPPLWCEGDVGKTTCLSGRKLDPQGSVKSLLNCMKLLGVWDSSSEIIIPSEDQYPIGGTFMTVHIFRKSDNTNADFILLNPITSPSIITQGDMTLDRFKDISLADRVSNRSEENYFNRTLCARIVIDGLRALLYEQGMKMLREPPGKISGTSKPTEDTSAGQKNKDPSKVRVWIQRTADDDEVKSSVISLDKLAGIFPCHQLAVHIYPEDDVCTLVAVLNRLVTADVSSRFQPGLLEFSGAEDKHLASLSKLKKLWQFSLSTDRKITDTGLSHLVALTGLRRLYLSECVKITNAGLAHLSGLKQLRELDLYFCVKITDVGLAHLSGLKQLQKLNLDSCYRITDAGLVHLSGLKQLQELDLSECDKITDAGLVHLSEMKQLREFNLSECVKITDAGLAHLSGLKRLRRLDLGGCSKITDAGLSHLAGLKELRQLSLWGCKNIGNAGLAHLSGMKELRELFLNGSKITDAGLAHLSELKELRDIELKYCDKITDAGLAYLAGLKELRTLSLVGCEGITDAGLVHLAGLKKLRELNLRNCSKITDAGTQFKLLETALQHCVIFATPAEMSWNPNVVPAEKFIRDGKTGKADEEKKKSDG